ncbi:MAG: hypothetical protein ACI9G1_001055 [Pirellulaceae bacterium]|jgi:hypothetical protein
MIKSLLRELLEHRARHWIVIIITAGLGLVLTKPMVDDYIAKRSELAELQVELEETQYSIAQLTSLKTIRDRKIAELGKVVDMSVNHENMQEFRNQLVAIIRRSGCTMRSVRPVEPVYREWGEEDDPLGDRLRPGQRPSGFELRSQQFNLSATGTMANVTKLLQTVHGLEKLIHCKAFSVQKSEEEEGQVILDLELLLFNLDKPRAVSA